MTKEYMLKRIEKYCKSHNYELYVDCTAGVHVLVDNDIYDDNICHDRFFPNLTSLYNYLFVRARE